MVRLLFLTSRISLKKSINSLLALPLSGAAAIFIRQTPLFKPKSSFLEELGVTFTDNLALIVISPSNLIQDLIKHYHFPLYFIEPLSYNQPNGFMD
jgi:hypothetical protein